MASSLSCKNKSRHVKPALPSIRAKGLNYWARLEFELEAHKAVRTYKFNPNDLSVPVVLGPEFPEPLAALRARLDDEISESVEPSRLNSLHLRVQRLAIAKQQWLVTQFDRSGNSMNTKTSKLHAC
jgi:phosphoribosylformylglycinamidine (FGAM) synthase-like enzyme